MRPAHSLVVSLFLHALVIAAFVKSAPRQRLAPTTEAVAVRIVGPSALPGGGRGGGSAPAPSARRSGKGRNSSLGKLLRFETDNRAFFEARINSRPAAYYSPDGVRAAIVLAEREAAEDKGYQFLVRTGAGELVGRVNLIGVRRTHFQMADLGYRMAESACGKGYASEAVRLVLEKAFGELGLHRVIADVDPRNLPSLQVAERLGMRKEAHFVENYWCKGEWTDSLIYALLEREWRQTL